MNSPEFNSQTVNYSTIKHEITFIDTPDAKCVQVCTAMVLKELLPKVDFSWDEVVKLTGYKEGLNTWGTQHLLSLNDLGIETAWIENVDLDRFSLAPFEYMRTSSLDDTAYRFQVEHSDLPLEARRVQQYLDRGLSFQEREATVEDIKQFLFDGWLVRLGVNGEFLTGQLDNGPHSVLVMGCNDDTVIFQKADTTLDQTVYQQANWEIFEQAWQECGSSKSLYAYRQSQ